MFTLPIFVLIAVIVGVGATIYYWPAPRLRPEQVSVGTLQMRVIHQDGMEPDVWPTGWPHEAPETPFTVPQAQLTMRRHRECARGSCPRKGAAWQVLVDNNVIRPATGRVR
jgi:hypothetical protein